MLDVKKPAISSNTPNWVPIVAALGLLLLIGGSMASFTIFVKVLTAAGTAAAAYLAVCFACHAVAMICDVLGGLGAVFQSWRS